MEQQKSFRVHTTLLASMCHAVPFWARAMKKNIFFDVDIVVKKNKSKCGLSWSVFLPTTCTCHYSFPKNVFVLFLHIKRVCKSFWKECLTSDAYKQLICVMQRVHFQVRAWIMKRLDWKLVITWGASGSLTGWYFCQDGRNGVEICDVKKWRKHSVTI